MFLWASGIALTVFLFTFIKIFKGRQHPYTILAYSGALSFAILFFELFYLGHFEWKTLFVLPVAVFMSWLSYSLSKKVGERTPKELILKSLIPMLFVLIYGFVINFWFLFPMVAMTLFVPVLIPTHIKEQRRNLFVQP